MMKMFCITVQGIYTRAICPAIITCDGSQRFAANAAPIVRDRSCVCCKSLRAIAGNSRRTYRSRVNPLLTGKGLAGLSFRRVQS